MSAAAVQSMRLRRIIRRFTNAGALAPASATTLPALDLRENRAFRSMAAYGALRRTPDGRYWLDAPQAQQYCRDRRMRALAATALILLLCLIAMLINTLREL